MSALRRAKLVCTLGPACDSMAGLRSLIAAGMDVARLNFSHGTIQEQGERLGRLREASELERKVFGDRPFYSMTLNMPNLNSAGGSWIMRFAELHDSGSVADLSAPRALHKVDPAYPLELMRQNVAGTVAVRAVIRADGSVSDVRVLRSVDDRLDHYACEALSHWQFEPATRSGTPVDLAVVVMIPFHPVARPHF